MFDTSFLAGAVFSPISVSRKFNRLQDRSELKRRYAQLQGEEENKIRG